MKEQRRLKRAIGSAFITLVLLEGSFLYFAGKDVVKKYEIYPSDRDLSAEISTKVQNNVELLLPMAGVSLAIGALIASKKQS
jgi:hypothetical protein